MRTSSAACSACGELPRDTISVHVSAFADYRRRRSGVTIGGNSMLGAAVLNALN